MAHLTCVEHGRRSMVFVRNSEAVTLHRSDRESCTSRLRFGKIEFSKLVAVQGNLRVVLNAATDFVAKATPTEWRPRKARRTPRR